MGHSDPWFANDEFWERMFPFMFPAASFDAAAENVAKIVTLTGVSQGVLLDLACGPGRYAIPFAKAGFSVTGVDRTRWLLDKARSFASQERLQVEWQEQDMRDFVRPAAFDLVTSIFTSFGYFDEASENERVLANIGRSLKPGGKFVIDVLGKEVLAARLQPTRSEVGTDGRILIHRTTIIDDWSRIEGEWILLDGERAEKFQLRHWIYSARELRSMLSAAGFSEVVIHGDFGGAAYGPQAQRLIAVATKAAD